MSTRNMASSDSVSHLRGSSVSVPCAVCNSTSAGRGSPPEPLPSSFQEIQHFSVLHCCIREIRCMRTRMRVFVCNIPSPTCTLHVSFKTETHTEEGLPHTLEHLVFLGSKNYPYKGFLDLAAARCLSQGTNAWTATDHTTYTLNTAGYKGLETLLPIYLEHLLLPTLDDDAFFTEVHHFKPDGRSAGVVYSEMEACERTANSVANSALLSLLYPGDSGYTFETGGRMQWLRTTTNARVKAYHKAFYRWENMALMATGTVPVTRLLKTLEAATDKIFASCVAREETAAPDCPPANVASGAAANTAAAGNVATPSTTSTSATATSAASTESPSPPLKSAASAAALDTMAKASDAAASGWRAELLAALAKPLTYGAAPWTSPVNVAPLHASCRTKVCFPADASDTGRVVVGWRGAPWKCFEERAALDVLGYYLTDTNAAILEREMVECRNALCSAVEFGSESFQSTCLYIEASDVTLLQRGASSMRKERLAEEPGELRPCCVLAPESSGKSDAEGAGDVEEEQLQQQQGWMPGNKSSCHA
ncbi:peptidase M16 domain-containing protein [Cyclospora cayetanensis]|uniref:Peptidase M16 domain-containing protein n=1 Tax=Cyclospora cayetanensis TaxID=88456 RepID=A0A1D3CQZ6_9EIME|nr:peptidase M16 domain-containing protein [Cyclospora cayetanensis]